jgi:hypothetical protein
MIRVLKLPDSLLRRTERGGALKLVLVSRVATRFALAIQEALSFPDPTKREKKNLIRFVADSERPALVRG